VITLQMASTASNALRRSLATTYGVTTIAKPGVIHHTGTTARIHCGRLDRRPDAILVGYVKQMKAANADITLRENMLLDIWKKFVLLTGTSGMTASTRKSLGLISEDADMRALLLKLMHETTAVGRAAGVDLPEDCNGVGSINSGLTSNYESINGERPRGRQAP
jgi:ketopantoate reductase